MTDDTDVEVDVIVRYVRSSGNFTIRTRQATNVVYSKNAGSRFPLNGLDVFREVSDERAENPEMDEGEIVISEHGTDYEEKVVLE